MTEQELLHRIEQQAVRIAELEQENALLRTECHEQGERVRLSVLTQLSNAAVNCGSSYGCSLARRYLNG